MVVSKGRRTELPSGEAMEAGTSLGTNMWLERMRGWDATVRMVKTPCSRP